MTFLAPAILLLACPITTQDPADPAVTAPVDEGLLIGIPALPEQAEVIMLRLRNGEIRWGAIIDHDPDGFRFGLLAHGGTVELGWERLDPSQELALRQSFNYVDVSTEELMVDVETLLLIDGKELTGVILSRDGDHFVLKHEGSLQMIPKKRVQNTIKGHRLPALDVYTREELYSMYSAKTDIEDPDAQLELAQLCEQILDFDHAVEHYEAVITLDVDTDRQDVELALERAVLKAGQQAQIDYLRSMDLLRKRHKFDEALAQAEAFSEIFPGSPLIIDALKARDRILVARDATIRDLVRREWLDHTRRVARVAAKQLNYEAAVAYCEEGYSEAVLAAVTADVHRRVSEEVEEDDVMAYWATRKKVRFYNATYGTGTWLLGEERALASTGDQSASQNKPVNERDSQRQALEEKIQKFLKNQSSARRRRSSSDQADDYAAGWASMSVDDKSLWIRAYYVEFSGDFELRDHPHLRNCPSCGGRGVHEIINAGATISAPKSGRGGRGGSKAAPGSGVQLIACSTCHGIGRSRRVYYR